jgi:hypothetical protein
MPSCHPLGVVRCIAAPSTGLTLCSWHSYPTVVAGCCREVLSLSAGLVLPSIGVPAQWLASCRTHVLLILCWCPTPCCHHCRISSPPLVWSGHHWCSCPSAGPALSSSTSVPSGLGWSSHVPAPLLGCRRIVWGSIQWGGRYHPHRVPTCPLCWRGLRFSIPCDLGLPLSSGHCHWRLYPAASWVSSLPVS